MANQVNLSRARINAAYDMLVAANLDVTVLDVYNTLAANVIANDEPAHPQSVHLNNVPNSSHPLVGSLGASGMGTGTGNVYGRPDMGLVGSMGPMGPTPLVMSYDTKLKDINRLVEELKRHLPDVQIETVLPCQYLGSIDLSRCLPFSTLLVVMKSYRALKHYRDDVIRDIYQTLSMSEPPMTPAYMLKYNLSQFDIQGLFTLIKYNRAAEVYETGKSSPVNNYDGLHKVVYHYVEDTLEHYCQSQLAFATQDTHTLALFKYFELPIRKHLGLPLSKTDADASQA